MKQVDCDLCIIGAGPAGLTAAAAAAQLGRRVVLIENRKMGGDCLNHGCVPSKALIAAANRAHALRSADSFGITAGLLSVDFARVMAHVRSVIAAIEPDDSQKRFESLGCTVVRDHASFIDQASVRAGDRLIKARRFLIATGSLPRIPDIDGLASAPHFTSDSIFANDTLPSHLIIIGAGPMGLELAQAFRRLGSRVTVIEALSPLAGHDKELAAPVLEAFAREAVEILSPCRAVSVGATAERILVKTEAAGGARDIEGSHLLIAAGRKPNVEGLNLAAAGIEYSERGIRVDVGLKTSNRRVYAAGDVAGGLQFTHVAAHQAGLVIRNALFRLPVRYDENKMPRATFTDPELAEVGLSEAAAHAAGRAPRILRWPLSRSDKARIERRPAGQLKIVVSGNGRIIGAGITGPNAAELISPWAQMIQGRRKIAAMAGAVVPYPSYSEDSRRAALTNYAPLAANPWVRRLIDVLCFFG